MADRYEKIRQALAMGPTPGPYEIYQDGGRFYVETTTRQSRCGVFKVLGSPESERLANAELAAACDPDTIQALLDECDALRAEVAEWKRVAAAQVKLHVKAEIRAERLAEALEMCLEMEERPKVIELAKAALAALSEENNND